LGTPPKFENSPNSFKPSPKNKFKPPKVNNPQKKIGGMEMEILKRTCPKAHNPPVKGITPLPPNLGGFFKSPFKFPHPNSFKSSFNKGFNPLGIKPPKNG